ncbi:MAG: hypothetical protein KA436_11505 [Oligoflexales bacterium]|nr:hypothetical protein [Oligoflexales bacterium]
MTRYIKASVELHDRTQVEIIFDYDLELQSQDSLSQLLDKPKVDVDAFLFFPAQMGINSKTYKKADFYENIRPLIKLKEPVFFPDEEEVLENNTFLKITEFVESESSESLPGKKGKDSMKIFTGEMKARVQLFACSFTAYFKKKINKRVKQLSDSMQATEGSSSEIEENLEKSVENCLSFLKFTHAILKQWADLRMKLDRIQDESLRDISSEIVLMEEFLSYKFREGLAKLLLTLDSFSKTKRIRRDEKIGVSEEYRALKTLRWKLRAWSRLGSYYARKKGFLSIDGTSSLEDREIFSSRLSMLKKHMRRGLNLEIQSSSSFALRKEWSYVLAVSLAAGWAFIANVMITHYLGRGGGSLGGGVGNFLGLGGTTLVFAFIVAYVLTDRIKELGKVKFGEGVFGKMPDNSYDVIYSDIRGREIKVGKIHERVEFMDGIESVPSEINQLRDEHFEDLMKEEREILHYNKQITVFRKAISKIRGPRFRELRDIIRLSVRRYLSKLEDPLQSYVSVNRDGLAETLIMPKVYSIDIVLKYSQKNLLGRLENVSYTCKRLTINKNGLVRVEQIYKSSARTLFT